MTVLLFLAMFLQFPQRAVADEGSARDIVVQAPRILDESIEASRSVDIIDENEIHRKNALLVADLLRDLPGVDVVAQGPVGQTVSVFIRGARSEDTLVLIDGVEANDAMSPSGGYDFSSLSPENIERIEVYRGPQSVRFGGGALGGVINIVTKEGSGPLSLRYFAEAGSADTAQTEGGISGQSGQIGYSATVAGIQTKGFPAADALDGNSLADGAQVGSASSKVTWRRNSSSTVSTSIRYTKTDSDLARHGGAGGDDWGAKAQGSELLTAATCEDRFFSERLKSTLGLYYSETARSDSFPVYQANTTSLSDSFLSEKQKIDSNHELFLDERNSLRLNLQWQRATGTSTSFVDNSETFVPRSEQSDWGEGVTYLYESSTWFGDLGIRADELSSIGTVPSERASLGRTFEDTDTRLSLTYGTGYKAPSLYQLYSSYGNPALTWESASTWEFTIEQNLAKVAKASIGLFQNRYQNMIDFEFSSNHYQNISSAVSTGVEVQTTISMSSELNLTANYTYLNAVDNSTGLALVRRPQNATNLELRYKKSVVEIFSTIRYEDVRPDVDPISFARTSDSAYIVCNVGATYTLNPSLNVSARIENLFARQYEEVAGYGTPGFSYFLGLHGIL